MNIADFLFNSSTIIMMVIIFSGIKVLAGIIKKDIIRKKGFDRFLGILGFIIVFIVVAAVTYIAYTFLYDSVDFLHLS